MAMDLKQLIKEEENNNNNDNMNNEKKKDDEGVDTSSALQSFLDHIPITPIISSSSVLELRLDDCIRDAISLLYTKNVSGAPIIDHVDSDIRKFVDRDIGFIEFSSMVLWSLEEFEKVRDESTCSSDGFLSMLEQNPQIGHAKIGELAKSFLWEPFFPVNSNDTLLHMLLLFAKHPRLNVIPVVESSNSRVVGFIDQNAVVQLLLESSGLDWFDQIADKTIAEFGFEKDVRSFRVYGNQSLADALHVLWVEQADGVPVVDQGDDAPIGIVRRNDIPLIVGDNIIFNNRKGITVEEFIKNYSDNARESRKVHHPSTALLLKNDSPSRMNTFVTNRRSDSLKEAMKSLVASNCSQSLLVNEMGKLEGILTLRDIISHFSPPSVDSRIDGGGFFKDALEQAGCDVEGGSLICNN